MVPPRRRPRGRPRRHGHGNPITTTSIHRVARLSRAAGKLRLQRHRGSRDLRRVKHALEETWAFLRGVVGDVDARDLPLARGLFLCPSMLLAMAMTEQLVLEMDAAVAAGHGDIGEEAAAGAGVEED